MAFVSGGWIQPRLSSSARARCTVNSNHRGFPASRSSPRKRSVVRMTEDFGDIAKQMAQELGMEMEASTAQGDVPELGTGENGQETVTLRHTATNQQVTVYLMGATVQSWKVGKNEMFWTSDVADWTGKKAIRAGIPICFPQFGPFGDLPTHGFARITKWEVKSLECLEDGSAYAVFSISNSTPSEYIEKWSGGKQWEAEYAVTLSATGLETSLSVRNDGTEPIEFTAALHNYLSVTDVKMIRVYGLDKCTYQDRMDSDKLIDVEDDKGMGTPITEETDRIYRRADQDLAVFDMGSLRLYKIMRTDTFPDATLWNPFGADGADPGWQRFLCLEPARIEKPAVVNPGETWVGAQLINVVI